MSEKKTLLKVENATMQFGGVVAVDNLNLEVNEGEIVALIGPNGAGKTTAFNVITGVYAPSNGRITFDGECIVRNHPTGKMKKLYKGKHPTMYTAQFAPEEMLDDASLEVWKAEQKARDEFAFTDRILEPTPDKITDRGMARTFQNIRLWKTQTVFDNVLIAKHMRRSSGFFSATFRGNRKEEAKQREEVLELLRIVGLEDVKDELATQPKLLLLDEPAAGMNPQETIELTEFIAQIRKDFHMTILLIEHHMDLVMDISDRIYVLDFGELIAQGVPAEIQANDRVIDAYLGVADDAEN